MFEESILTEIKNHAHSTKPEECCGLIVSQEKQILLFKARNVSEYDKKFTFTIHPEDLIKASLSGKITHYYHSHNTESDGVFSERDILNYKLHGICSIIYNTTKDQFYFLNNENNNGKEVDITALLYVLPVGLIFNT